MSDRPWAQLSNGMKYDFTACEVVGDLHVEYLAHALAGTARYNAWTHPYWSVASHAVLVAEILAANADNSPRVTFGGLHHDDHEAITGDWIAPLQWALSPATQTEIRLVQVKAQRALLRGIGILDLIPDDGPSTSRIKAADLAALEAERRLLYPERMEWATEAYVDQRMLEDGDRILRNGLMDIPFGAPAAARYVARHRTLLAMVRP